MQLNNDETDERFVDSVKGESIAIKVYKREPTFEFLEGMVTYSGHIKILSSDVFLNFIHLCFVF